MDRLLFHIEELKTAVGGDEQLGLLLLSLFLFFSLLLSRARRRRLSNKVLLVDSKDPKNSKQEKAREGKQLVEGLGKTRGAFLSRFSEILKGRVRIDSEVYEALEELLIGSDIGVKTSGKLLAALKEDTAGRDKFSETELRELLKENVFKILRSDFEARIVPEKRGDHPLVVIVVGVNGVGKTTTIGKLAASFAAEGRKVLLGACDTFRAAASDQLGIWANRAGVDLVAGEDGEKPSTVAFRALTQAKEGDYDVLLLDTAGRLHTRVNLMNELESVVRIAAREIPGSPHESILVLDATTGQNALQQAREFHSRTSLSGIVVSKLDGSPKGGMLIAVKDELNVPIRYIGIGEGIEDLRVFSARDFVDALFTDEPSGSNSLSSNPLSEEMPQSGTEVRQETAGRPRVRRVRGGGAPN